MGDLFLFGTQRFLNLYCYRISLFILKLPSKFYLNINSQLNVTDFRVKIKNMTKNLPERYNTRAAESSFFIPIADNVTVDLKVYFMDNFKRRSPPFFKYNLTKEFIEGKIFRFTWPKLYLGISFRTKSYSQSFNDSPFGGSDWTLLVRLAA